MLITGREARAKLAELGVSDRRARVALQCGLAGAPVVTRAAHLFDEARVDELGRRREMTLGEALRHCPRLYITRQPVDVGDNGSRLREHVRTVPGEMSLWTSLWFHLDRGEGLPLVATVAGFVVHGATIVNATGFHLELTEPGEWYDAFVGTQLVTGKGRQWVLLSPPGWPFAA